MNTLYITGAGVSAESGIPTFRGTDGYWTIGSKNYTPQEMATRAMYQNNPIEFLSWYYHRFASFRNYDPNEVHQWLADKIRVEEGFSPDTINLLEKKGHKISKEAAMGAIQSILIKDGKFYGGADPRRSTSSAQGY